LVKIGEMGKDRGGGIKEEDFEIIGRIREEEERIRERREEEGVIKVRFNERGDRGVIRVINFKIEKMGRGMKEGMKV